MRHAFILFEEAKSFKYRRGIIMKVLCLLTILFAGPLWAQSKVAIVKMIRGEANVVNNGKSQPIKAEDWVSAGSVVKTAEKSFVRLVFIDKSQMNIGPSSEMKIEKFGSGDSGVIDLVKGKIRSQVSKDYLQQKDKTKSKMFVKTPNAVMGIRGTDFLISTNGQNSSAVLFEGEVVFNKVENANLREISTSNLEALVDRGVRIFPGEFSVVEVNRPAPTVPSLMNVKQIETLEKNQDFSADRNPSDQGSDKSSKSVVPKGLSGVTVSNKPAALDKELNQKGLESSAAPQVKNAETAKGFEQGDKVKPANGSFLHVDSGVVIAPSKDSVYDANSNTFVADSSSGNVGSDGDYVPPKNITITNSGKILASSGGKIIEVKQGSLAMGSNVTLGDVMTTINSSPDINSFTTIVNGVAVIDPLTNTNLRDRIIEAPTLCSTCGGAVPGSASNVSGRTPVRIETGVDP